MCRVLAPEVKPEHLFESEMSELSRNSQNVRNVQIVQIGVGGRPIYDDLFMTPTFMMHEIISQQFLELDIHLRNLLYQNLLAFQLDTILRLLYL